MDFFRRRPEYQSVDDSESAAPTLKAKIKQESKASTGILSRGMGKAAIGLVPGLGSAINTMAEETQNAVDNREAKNKLLEELKYSILLVQSCQNLIDYIDHNQFSKYVCDFENLQLFKQLQNKLIDKLREIKNDDELNMGMNVDIENLFIRSFTKNMDKIFKVDEKYNLRRKAIIDHKKSEISHKLALTYSPPHMDFGNVDKQIRDSKEQIANWEIYIKLVEFLTNSGLSQNRLFLIDSTGKKIYLKLEDFLKNLGLNNFANPSDFDRYTSNISKYLHNLVKIHEWMSKPQNAELSHFSGSANSQESNLIIPLLYYFTTLFDNTIENLSRNDPKMEDNLLHLQHDIWESQARLMNCDLLGFGLLMNAFNNPTQFRNQLDVMKSSLRGLETGIPVPQTRERFKTSKEMLSTARTITSLVNYRIDLNIVATQLNTYYQDLLFQIFQIKTTNPEEREAMLCPDVSIDLFV